VISIQICIYIIDVINIVMGCNNLIIGNIKALKHKCFLILLIKIHHFLGSARFFKQFLKVSYAHF